MKKICFVATIPKSLAVFLSDVIQKTSKQYTVKIISSPLGREVLDQLSAFKLNEMAFNGLAIIVFILRVLKDVFIKLTESKK